MPITLSLRPITAAFSDGKAQPSRSVIVIQNKDFDVNFSSQASNPSGGITATKHALSSDTRSTTFSSENLPIGDSNDSPVFPGDFEIRTTEMLFSLTLGDDLPNESASFVGKLGSHPMEDWSQFCQTCRTLGKEFRFASYLDPKSADAPVKRCPHGQHSSKSSQTTSKGSESTQGSVVTGYSGPSYGSYLVTGLGRSGGGGRDDDDDDNPWRPRPQKLTPSHYTEFAGFTEEQPMDAQRRVLLSATPEEAQLAPMSFVGRGDNHVPCDAMTPVTPITPTSSYLLNEVPVTAVEQSGSEIEMSFDLLRLMNHRTSAASHQEGLPSPSPSVAQMSVGMPSPCPSPIPLTPSPVTPTPSFASQELSSPIPTSPQVTTTPQQATVTAPSGLFYPKTYTKGDERFCELYVPEDLPHETRIMPLRALFHCANMYTQFAQCLEQPCDLKVAADVKAKLCNFNFDHQNSRLLFSMPKECELWESSQIAFTSHRHTCVANHKLV